ncbi:MAG: tetratricopeptide repeat protein [Candidatus Obscuribacterales bacterium]|nr:tetratricopeptide repeat protein [Candidatus Obscuribacterales bacterium]
MSSKIKNLAIAVALSTLATGAALAADSSDAKDSEVMQKAEKLYKDGKLQEAANQFREAIRLEPDNAKAHQRLGIVLAAIGTITKDEAQRKEIDDTAILEEKQSAKLDPKHFLPHVVLGQIYANRAQFDDAVKEFKQAITLKPDSFRSHLDLGIAYTHLDKEAEALAAYRKAAELKPDAAVPHINIGVLLQSQGDFKGAIEAENTALSLKPNPYEAHAANFNMGNIYADANQPDNAIKAYQAALKVNPRHLLSQSGIGWMEAKKGNYAEAIATQRKVLKAAAQDPIMAAIARGRLATALAEKGDTKEAEKEFEKCMAAKPPNPITMMEYGRYLEKTGRKGEAKKLFQNALSIQPSFKPAKEALAKLENGSGTK